MAKKTGPRSKHQTLRNKKRSHLKENGIDPKKLNAAGFYDGMPGVWLDSEGNQRILEFGLTPEGEVFTRYGTHPANIQNCVASIISESPQTRAILLKSLRKWITEEENKRIKRRIMKFFGIKPVIQTEADAPKKETSKLSDKEYQKEIDKLNEMEFEEDAQETQSVIDINKPKTEA